MNISLETKDVNLLQLVMIVKDCEDVIVATLKSWIPFISYWYIMDTGSSDNTIEIIKKTMSDAGIDGQLITGTFVSFEETRNEVLKQAPKRCIYTAMPDDSYIINGPLDKVLKYIHCQAELASYEVISLKIKDTDNCSYYRNIIMRNASNLKYVGGVHAYIDSNKIINVDDTENGIFIFDNNVNKIKSSKRWFDDIKNIKESYDKGENPRDAYNLAMTYYGLYENSAENRSEEAEKYLDNSILYFRTRIAFNDDYHEEKFVSCMNLATLLSFHKKDSKNSKDSKEEALVLFFRAMKIWPARSAECLYKLYLIYKEEKMDDLAKMFLKQASTYKMPNNNVSMDINVYNKYIPDAIYFETMLEC